MSVIVQDIRRTVRGLGISGDPVCVHSSLRSFGWVEGGASTVVSGLLAEGCTVLVPTFSWTFAIPPPLDMRPRRNGWDYENFKGPTSGIGRVYTPLATEIDKDMGAIPTSVLSIPERVRGNHPLCSFSAVGSLAHHLISTQEPLDMCAPLKMLAEKNGFILLMGVDLHSLTMIHLAEKAAGRTLFRRWANDPMTGKAMQVEVGGCSAGFDSFEPVLWPLMRKAKVGESTWRVFPAKKTLETAIEAISKDPNITRCDDPECERCNDAIMGGPITTTGYTV